MNILFSIDDRFVEQLKTTLYSLASNNRVEKLHVYVLQKELLERHDELVAFCRQLDVTYYPIIIGENQFTDAPVSNRYPETIYYRLLAHQYLPQELDRVLYLDADILCINEIRPLYDLDLSGYLYAAASHAQVSKLATKINQVRLKSYEAEGYFNSGVLLMNLEQIRKTVNKKDVFRYIETNRLALILPDQDILNALYGDRILSIPDEVYNYDSRYYPIYVMKSGGVWKGGWVMEHTVFIHFCGKDKPWQEDENGRFSLLYKHYWHQSSKI